MHRFLQAKPIWLKGKEQDVNCRVQFKAICQKSKSAFIRLATSGIYQLFINGRFVSYGPARAGRNHFRMDNIEISHYLVKERNVLIIETAGYFCQSFYVMRQDSFLQAEVVCGDNVLVCTGRDFSARIRPDYIQKIQRYSYQRLFAEAYRLNSYDDFLQNEVDGSAVIAETDKKIIIERNVPYTDFEVIGAEPAGAGSLKTAVPEQYTYDRYITSVNLGENGFTGWKVDELDCLLEKDWQEMHFFPSQVIADGVLTGNHYCIYAFPHNAVGMIYFNVHCEKNVTVYLAFDEILSEKIVNPRRTRSCNIVRYELAPGDHILRSFEVYTMQYLQVVALGGDCLIDGVSLIEYKHPPLPVPVMSNSKLQTVVNAAVETFRQNAVDLFTDCPSRERAGWLCDSFFLARAEYALTGKNIMEETFLENFLFEEHYAHIPKGMVPMCYPADHPDGQYIPNWALWLVLELADYYKRGGKTELIESFRNKVYGILKYFRRFENQDGLLENLQGWVFAEWSLANELTSGVHYPSNMLYYAAVKAVSVLYHDNRLADKAEKIKREIIRQAFQGDFFIDHAIRTPDGIVPVLQSTEVCQYYAFFSGVATIDTHSKLLSRLVWQFGPCRDVTRTFPEICACAPFIGYFLRLEVLFNNGFVSSVTDDICEYFYKMAAKTGTLWEKSEPTSSCCHGFASGILYWLIKSQENRQWEDKMC